MLKKIGLLSLMCICSLNAFEIRSWNLNDIKSNDNRNYITIKQYTNQIYDVMCLQGIYDGTAIEYTNDNKNIYYSNANPKKPSLGWLVKPTYQKNVVLEYENEKFSYPIKPSMLQMKDINLGVINFQFDNVNKIDTIDVIKEINEIFRYFSNTSGIPVERLFMCGSFDATAGKMNTILGNYFYIGNNEGSIVSEQYGYTNDDFDHIISMNKTKVSPDHSVLKLFDKDYSIFKSKVSTHIPLKVNY